MVGAGRPGTACEAGVVAKDGARRRQLPVRRGRAEDAASGLTGWPAACRRLTPPPGSFTTIDPQRAVGYLQIDCACARFGLADRCRPNHGACVAGRRSVPIELLDVAGLVPGAHQGRGLGNRFLDDLRHAEALVHVVDAEGTVDAEGKETRGYDPSADIAWLRAELVAWVLGNLAQKWGSVRRRHAAKATAVETLHAQFSGYGATAALVARALDRAAVRAPLEDWADDTLRRVVDCFVDEKFPTVIALNKIDHPDADKNIAKIAKMHDPTAIVLCSAISEVFLRKMAKQGYVRYVEGADSFDTRDDLVEQGDPAAGGLKPLEDKIRNRIENLRDMVLYRFGSTGVVQVLSRAADLLGLVPVFPVRNTTTFASGASEAKAVFRDCVLVNKSSTVGDVARKVMGDAPIAFVEGVGGLRVADDDLVAVGRNDVSALRALGPYVAHLAPDPVLQGGQGLSRSSERCSARPCPREKVVGSRASLDGSAVATTGCRKTTREYAGFGFLRYLPWIMNFLDHTRAFLRPPPHRSVPLVVSRAYFPPHSLGPLITRAHLSPQWHRPDSWQRTPYDVHAVLGPQPRQPIHRNPTKSLVIYGADARRLYELLHQAAHGHVGAVRGAEAQRLQVGEAGQEADQIGPGVAAVRNVNELKARNTQAADRLEAAKPAVGREGACEYLAIVGGFQGHRNVNRV